jgi:hypothetical protein
MSKAKLTAAKELINEKQFDAARAILVKIDDPLAKKWLDKLDEIAPVSTEITNKKKSSLWIAVIATMVIMLFAIIIGILVFFNRANISQQETQSQQISLPVEGQKALIQRVNSGVARANSDVAGQVYKVERVQKATDPSQFLILSGGISFVGSSSDGIITDLPDELWCISSDTPVNVKVLTSKTYNSFQDVEGVTRFLVYRKGLLWNAVPSDSSKWLPTETGMNYDIKDVQPIWLKAGCEW